MHIDFNSPDTIEEQLRKKGFALNGKTAEIEAIRNAIEKTEGTVATMEEVRRMRFRLSSLVEKTMASKEK